jgi:multicomponent Na+:H+ antiporter subunit D
MGYLQQGAVFAADWLVVLPVVVAMATAALLVIANGARELQWGGAVLGVAAVVLIDAALLARVLELGPVSLTMGNWLPPFGISFTVDVVGAAFALVAAGVTLVLLVYLGADMPDGARERGVYPLILLLLAGVSGAFLTGDLFNLYVWFELMLIASFGLMALGGRDVQLDATVKYGFLNFLATAFFLLALGLLYGLLGTLNMADIVGAAARADAVPMAGIGALLLLAFGMKAAAFPVNAWLPASYHAPPPAISALLAGLLTKVGVYALLRSLGMLMPGARDLLDPTIALVAIGTLVIGPLGAIAETNLRRALGFLLIGGIGATMAGLALGNLGGLAGAVAYTLHAMLTMTALYMLAGVIEAMTGTTDTRQMGGLYAAASLPSVLFFGLMLAVAGVPPFLGFWPKLLLVDGGFARWGFGADPLALALWLAVLANALLSLIAGARLWSHIFWRPGHDGETSEVPNTGLRPLARREAWLKLSPTLVLAMIVLLLGLFPEPLLSFARQGAEGLIDPQDYIAATGITEAAR